MPTLYRILDVHSYLDREEEYAGLTLEEAAHRMDDLTGVGADVILSDWDELCERCHATGVNLCNVFEDCSACGGNGKWPGPWKWTDEETGRKVTMRREVEA